MIIKPIIPIPVAASVLGILFVTAVFFILKHKDKWWKKTLGILRMIGIFGLIFLINLKIMTERFNVDVELKNIDVIFAVDTTISMWSDDYGDGQTRIDGVSENIKHIMNELGGSSFALMRFDNTATVLAPFTEDTGCIEDALDTIHEPSNDYARGSSPNVAIDKLNELITSSQKKDGRKTIVFFYSDGEITDGSKLESFAGLEKYITSGAVIGVGTDKGGKMKDSSSGLEIINPETGKDAVSKYDASTINEIAKSLNVDSIHMTKKESADYLIDAIKAGSTVTIGKSNAVSYEDTYFYFAPFLAILMLWELVVVVRKRKI